MSISAFPMDYVGRWCGPVIIVYVEFDFKVNSFEERTYASNNIQVGGTRGEFQLIGDAMHIHRTSEYRYDFDKLSGAWYPDEKNYVMRYMIQKDTIYLSPDTSDLIMELKQCGVMALR